MESEFEVVTMIYHRCFYSRWVTLHMARRAIDCSTFKSRDDGSAKRCPDPTLIATAAQLFVQVNPKSLIFFVRTDTG